MSKLKAIVLLCIISLKVIAVDPGPCDEIIKAGDALNASCNATVEAYRVTISDQDKLIVELTKQRNEAIKEYNSSQPALPWYLYVLIGGAAATVAIGLRR